MAKVTITADTILTALDHSRPTNYTALYRAMGGRSKPAGSTIKRLKSLVRDLDKRLQANKGEAKPSRRTGKSRRKKWKRHPQNPYREGSNYSIGFDILSSFRNGLPREKFETLYAKATGKSKEKSRFDAAVILSPKSESPTSERHRSTREGYGVRKEGSHVLLVLPK